MTGCRPPNKYSMQPFPRSSVAYPALHTLRSHANRSDHKLHTPSAQLQTVGLHTQTPLRRAADTGRVLWNTRERRPMHQQIFQNMYHEARSARQDLAAGTRVGQKVWSSPDWSQNCSVFPPLLVRFRGTSDVFAPLKLLEQGRIQGTKGVPDAVLNFHADTRAVTLTLCLPVGAPPTQIARFEFFISVLYSLNNAQPLNKIEFVAAYDRKRIEILRARVQPR